MNPTGTDPRHNQPSDMSWRDDGVPLVGQAPKPENLALIIGAFSAIAVALFLFLNGRQAQQISMVTPVQNASPAVAPPPPLEIPHPAPPPPPPAPAPIILPPPPPVVIAPPPLPVSDMAITLKAPAVVVDLQTPVRALASGTSSSAATKPAVMPSEPVPAVGGITGSALAAASATDQFAAHAAEATSLPAVAMQMTHLDTTIAQGATISGILETALNSDLPGYTRGMVSRDVRAFDGKSVLIPRGSSLIGQYRNAISLGQSRIFVIWTRLIRPDGVSVQIGSPGGDALGGGGLSGEVNTHFFARFGGSILLSVLNAGTAAIAGTPSTQVTIGSPAAAVGAAASASMSTGSDIAPTIKVMQGTPITIFVARDLDFSGVKPVP